MNIKVWLITSPRNLLYNGLSAKPSKYIYLQYGMKMGSIWCGLATLYSYVPNTECGEVYLAPQAEPDSSGLLRRSGQSLLQSKAQLQVRDMYTLVLLLGYVV